MHALYRLVNTVGACLAGADAICMAILAVSVLAWEGTENATKADKAVVVIQLLVLIGGISFWFSQSMLLYEVYCWFAVVGPRFGLSLVRVVLVCGLFLGGTSVWILLVSFFLYRLGSIGGRKGFTSFHSSRPVPERKKTVHRTYMSILVHSV